MAAPKGQVAMIPSGESFYCMFTHSVWWSVSSCGDGLGAEAEHLAVAEDYDDPPG